MREASDFERFFSLVTGARKNERLKTIASFLAMFLLLLSYYMVKPLRNSQFLKEFNTDYLPFFFLFTAFVSVIVTKIFNSFYNKIEVFRLVAYSFFVMMACKLCFHFYLPVGGKTAIVLFYIFASVYFLLATAVLWGCINYIFTSEEGERCYSFIAIGSMIGGLVGSEISAVFSRGTLRSYALVFSALVMGSVLLFLLLAVKSNRSPLRKKTERKNKSEPQAGFFSDFQEIWANRYVRSLAVMMYAIAAFNTVLEFQSQKLIDQHMATQAYQQNFQFLEKALMQSGKQVSKETGFEFVFGLKDQPEAQRPALISAFVQSHDLNLKPDLLFKTYLSYQDKLEAQTREVFSKIYLFQNILGIALLFFVSRWLFQRMGVRFTVMILPSFYTVVILALFFPINLLMIESFLVIGYGLNYSLNRATRELLFTKTSDSTIFRLKPMIDGPVRRLGDVTMALLKLALTVFFVQFLHLPSVRADQIFFVTSLAILGFWIYSVWYVGGRYDQLKRESAAGLNTESEAD
ncbi:hypothetical protein COW36_04925 [bacterium (Candidatus Blackallbacteria) CG17_big_fil_post_rev_8_21_14_2_50_48_46]|uniref:ADP,ATP carrier protein n=1 Tax=bacterium (Candidatus Blackallbacteria) CG17_big_fil_post_rev_8_21_14_2_50_48_46 TaxID=2014261 RepID=A0A2M7G956_9BACT|nr:MAG: hypothetical protein COW64_04020 [bacterium (Candidatus Blackallbacteria) CG18_big_fil_WC_8_21_14_2_50_49_26]PIW18639.1 MAG: hypothetical protein COW36_04925 [bacterium (Candidatus Blackallbacteria) CG17_big_fil_post_rev_8_21_14_2_50_48_46]PIW46375.1 MAG: hypothetical protein COW20_15755 [bacterium (Candidatus Blackallbacteria) CG13_big_fil_rev_8_21_14_2_50_49_14]